MKYNVLNQELISAMTELSKDFPFELDKNGTTIQFCEIKERQIRVVKEADGYLIYADTKPHFFLALAKMMMAEQAGQSLEFSIQPAFEKNGLMLDNSRNAVASVEMVKFLLRKMAFMGHSWYMLYMEDVYEVDDEPYFGLFRGRYSQAELKELDDYADMLGIELIPCIQTLAHLNQFFYWEHEERKYKDIEDVMNVGKQETLALIEKMLKSLRRCFRSNRIHLGMDEAVNLGRGNYLEANGLQQKKDIMLSHLKNMLEICQKYQYQPIIWDDMFFTHYSSIGDDSDFRIPDQIKLMYWDYYNIHTEHYAGRIQQRSKIASETMFAGGAWRWTGYAPHHLKTLKSTVAALAACKQEKVGKVIATAWSDDGSECPFYTVLYGLTLFALLDYNEYDEAEFDRWLRFYTGEDYLEWMAQGQFDLLDGFDREKALDVTPSKYFLYQDLLSSQFLYYIKTIQDDYDTQLSRLEDSFAQRTAGNRQINEFYRLYAKTLRMKWKLPYQIWQAYRQADKQALADLVEHSIRKLPALLKQLLEARRQIWLTEANPMGLEVLEHRFGAMMLRTEIAGNRIQDYIDGKVERILELEEPRIDPAPAENKEEPQAIHYNRALRIMSVNREQW